MSKRSNFGHIQYISEGKYRIYWDCGHDEAGKRVQMSETVHGTRDEAEIALAMKRIGSHGIDRAMTWKSFWNRVVAPSFGELAAKTVSGYRRVWTVELGPRIGDRRVAETDYELVCDVIGSICAPSVQRAAHALWKKMCNMAMRQNPPLLNRNPVDRSVPMKRRARRKKHEVSASRIVCLIARAMRSRYWPLVVMEDIGGMRHEEACAVVGDDFSEEWVGGERFAVANVSRAIVHVDGKKVLKGPKTEDSERGVWFAEPFATPLLDLAESLGPLPFMPGPGVRDGELRESRFANPMHVSRNWRKWCERNGVEYTRFGDMRTGYSDLHAEAGSPDSLVSMSMGHDDGTTRGRNYMGRRRKSMAMLASNLVEYLAEECPALANLNRCYERLLKEGAFDQIGAE